MRCGREGEILNNLPQSLRSAVLLSMNKTVAEKLRQFPLFEGLEEDIITRVMAKLRFKSYPPGEIVLIEGEIGHSMYFINRGSLQVLGDGGTVKRLPQSPSSKRGAGVESINFRQQSNKKERSTDGILWSPSA